MANKKLITSVVAIATAAVLATGGTFAWQSINQRAINEASDVINPGGRLHNDLGFVDAKTTNSDIYVENFADSDIFARVRLEEYMEVVMNYGTAAEKVEAVAGSKTLKDGESVGDNHNGATEKDKYNYTYATHVFGLTDEEKAAGTENNKAYSFFDWKDGKDVTDKYYIPTFNKNKDSLLADLNGTYADSIGGISNRSAEQYVGENEITEISTETKFAIYDADENRVDELADLTAEQRNDIFARGETSDYFNGDSIRTVEETHNAATVGTTKGLISMADWLALGETYSEETHGNYWVYDTDGWVYWSSPIKAGEATGLLLDSFTLKQVMDDSWYYAINVVGQFVTASDSGKGKGTGFYDTENGTVPSENAEKLLEMIGIDAEEEVKGETYALTLLTSGDWDENGGTDIVSMTRNDSVEIKGAENFSNFKVSACGPLSSAYISLTRNTDFTYEDGVFKLTKKANIPTDGCVLCIEGGMNSDAFTHSGYVVVDADSTLVLKSSMGIDDIFADAIVAKPGDEITIVKEDNEAIEGKVEFVNIFSCVESEYDKIECTYSEGKLKLSEFNTNCIIYVQTDDSYAGCILVKMDTSSTPEAPEHTLSVAAADYDKTATEDGKTFYLYKMTEEAPATENISLSISYDDVNISGTDNLTISAYDTDDELYDFVKSTSFKGDGNIDASVDYQGNNKVYRLKIVAKYDDDGTVTESDPIYVSFYRDEIVMKEYSAIANISKLSEYLTISFENGTPFGTYSTNYSIVVANRAKISYGDNEYGIGLTKNNDLSGDTYETFSAEINGEEVEDFLKIDYEAETFLINIKAAGCYKVKVYVDGEEKIYTLNIS